MNFLNLVWIYLNFKNKKIKFLSRADMASDAAAE